MTKANVARGEVNLSLDGVDYVLDGSMENIARLQGALNVVGLAAALQMVLGMDPRAMLEGVRCLAVSGDMDKIGKMNFGRHSVAIHAALVKAIEGIPEPDAGNANGAVT